MGDMKPAHNRFPNDNLHPGRTEETARGTQPKILQFTLRTLSLPELRLPRHVSDAKRMDLSSRFGIDPSRAASAIKPPNQHQFLKEKCAPVRGHSEWPTEKRKVLRQRKNRHKKAPLKPLSATKEQNTKKSADCESALEEAATYSPTTKCSTIGVNGLNFSVRNGKRWDPTAITT